MTGECVVSALGTAGAAFLGFLALAGIVLFGVGMAKMVRRWWRARRDRTPYYLGGYG